MSSPFRMLVNGALVAGDQTLHVINPATETVVAEAPRATPQQLREAIDAAAAAFPAWAARTVDERKAVILRIAEEVAARAPEIARLIVLEQGMPLWEAEREVMGFCHAMRGTCAMDLAPEVLLEAPGRRVEVHRRPLGPVAIIVPWNHPALLIGVKLAPALLTGNTVVVKPAPTTPLTALKLAEIIAPLVPAGVVNIIADDNDLGSQLTSDPAIRKVSFTGSTATGRRIMSSGASTLKRLTMELGGNDPAIVFEDVDCDDLAHRLFHAAFRNSGQGCTATKRIYVHASIYEGFRARLEQLAAEARVGEGFGEGVEFGPLQNRRQYERVQALIQDSRDRGARVVGGELLHPGYFIRPCIVSDIADDAPVVAEEQFGPVLPILRFEQEDEVVARVNQGEFGLGASVWSGDDERARRVASRLETGSATVNKTNQPSSAIPFAGAKASGVGVEAGIEGLFAFTQLQVMDVAVL